MFWSFILSAHIVAASQVRSDDSGVIGLERVRAVGTVMKAVIDQGCRRSPVFAGLIRDIERSEYVVYIEAVTTLRNGIRGALLHDTGGKYLRIHIKLLLPSDKQVEVLAHELQHVREVIHAGINADAAKMESLFLTIGVDKGSPGRRQPFETDAAIRTADRVAADLSKNLAAGASVDLCRGLAP